MLSNACGAYVRAVVAANELDEVGGERLGLFKVLHLPWLHLPWLHLLWLYDLLTCYGRGCGSSVRSCGWNHVCTRGRCQGPEACTHGVSRVLEAAAIRVLEGVLHVHVHVHVLVLPEAAGTRGGSYSETLLDVLEAPPVCVQVALGADEVPAAKPEADGLLLCCQRLGVEPENSVYVGDSPTDGQAARAAGMKSIGVLWGAGEDAAL